MDAWLRTARDSVADVAGAERGSLDLTDEDAATLLELARIAAHDSGKRTNVPLPLLPRGPGDGGRGEPRHAR